MTKQACQCGCMSFHLYMDRALKNRITFVCQGCYCRRYISTPGETALRYEFNPPTVDGAEIVKPSEGMLERSVPPCPTP